MSSSAYKEMEQPSQAAGPTGPSLENRILQERIEAQLRLLEALNAIGHAITSSLCPSDVLKEFAREYKKLIPYDRMDIVLLVGDGEHYCCLGADADYDNPLGSDSFMAPIRESTLGRTVLETGEAMIFDDYDTDPRFLRTPLDEVIRRVEKIHSGLLVPLRARGRLIGSLDCGSKQIGRYNAEHLALAQRVADQIAPYLETLDLFQKERNQAERIAALNQINKEILLGLDFHTIVVTIAQETQNALKHDQIDIVLSDDVSISLSASLRTLPSGARVRLSIADAGGSDSIHIDAARLVQSPDEFFAARPFLSELFEEVDIGSLLALPLQARDMTLGLLLISSSAEGAFKNSDVSLAEQIADQIAVALEHERLVCRERDLAATEERNRLMLSQREREVRLSAQWLIEGAEQERGRLAMDLHDQTLGTLTLLSARAERLLTQQFQTAGSVKEEIAVLARGLKDSITEVREVMENLHPSTLDLLGLSDSIESCLYKAAQRAIPRIAVRFNNNLADEEPELNDLQKISLYRIVQEAINNAFEHSGAPRVEVSISKGDGSLLIEVSDNGCGFDASALTADSYGFRNMQYRAGLIGAELNISSNGSGTTVSVELPV
ncbi:MAG TPA: GAF domain-containing protein [Blastocatellia bacterium]|nr:GAF domain-containing protein [Blastocatellia bacterium]